jgi:RNA polymerase sigma factor (sigma-70 family)
VGDEELVRAARGGDIASFGLLLERHRASLNAAALGILGHGPQAEDAVQDTFVVALRKLDQLRDPACVGGWLHSILRNLCYAKLRAERPEVSREELPRNAEPSEASCEESIDRLAQREWIWAALGRLPETLRTAAMLRYFGSRSSYEEISAILGIPVGTVKSRLSQARCKLAEALLEAAGLEDSETRRLAKSRTGFFEAAYDEYNRGRGYELLAGAFSKDLVVEFSSGTTILRGHEYMMEDLEEDLTLGRKMYPTNILASESVAIIECDIENSPEDPFHCPPAVSQVAFYRDGRICRLRWHLAPRRDDDPRKLWTPEEVERRLPTQT